MTVTELAERIRIAASEEIDRSRRLLESVGLTWSEPTLVVSKPDSNEYTAELKVVFYRNGDIVDIFEFFVFDGGALKASESEVRQWIQSNVPDVVSRQRGTKRSGLFMP